MPFKTNDCQSMNLDDSFINLISRERKALENSRVQCTGEYDYWCNDDSAINDINDQNQLYVMAKDASELLDVESPTVIADTGYYNGTDIKICVDDGMSVYIYKR